MCGAPMANAGGLKTNICAVGDSKFSYVLSILLLAATNHFCSFISYFLAPTNHAIPDKHGHWIAGHDVKK